MTDQPAAGEPLVRERRFGERGTLLEFDSGAAVTPAYRALRAALADGRLPGVVELVPAARTLLVEAAPGLAVPITTVRELLAATPTEDSDDEAGSELLTLPVRYDGADLELVAETAGLSVEDAVALHASAEYTVAFCGFAPGFGYLVGLPEPLRQARLEESRSSVPPGSVGVAGEYTGVYPRSSPGGWRLLGRTEVTLFDPDADPPARLRPGVRVRFEPR